MPAFSTHYIFAKEMMPFLKEISDFELNEDSVYFATQGPDIFFFHRVFPWMPGKSLRKAGSLLHRAKPAEIIDAMREYEKISENPDLAKSYIYGFILHYALDRKCHPFVYSLQNKIVEKSPVTNPHTAHNTIELAMDSLLLHNRLGFDNPLLFNMGKTVSSDKNVIAETARLYEFIFPLVLNKNIGKAQIETALKDTKSVQNTLFDDKRIKRAIITPIEIIISPFTNNFKFTAMFKPKDLEKAKKYGNINNCEWISPYSNEIHNESFEQLFDLAKNEASAMISNYSKGDTGINITNNISFLTGVEVE
ncbi:MAG: zinc dependent phospholipase C family protein [Eubacterium sp.]